MSVASSSRSILQATLKRQLNAPLVQRIGALPATKPTASANLVGSPLLRQFAGTARYATDAYAQAQPGAHSASLSKSDNKASASGPEEKSESDPDEPPKKASFRERLRFLSRRYGWWALAVYLLASLADFSLVFGAIHMLGADHIRDLEDRFRKYIGVGKREMHDEEAAAWPVPMGAGVFATGGQDQGEIKHASNEEAARIAAKRVQRQEDVGITARSAPSPSSSSSSGGSGTLWTEVVLAYTIHKTLLLPFRVGVTAAITPSFVKFMVKLGWAKDNDAVRQAAKKVKMARDAAKAKAAPK